MFDHAYPIELAHFAFAIVGFAVATWNMVDEWRDCTKVDVARDAVAPVLRLYEMSIVAIFMTIFQAVSLAVAAVVIVSPPPPLPSLTDADRLPIFLSLLRAVAVIYAGLFVMTILALLKSLIRRFMRQRLMGVSA